MLEKQHLQLLTVLPQLRPTQQLQRKGLVEAEAEVAGIEARETVETRTDQDHPPRLLKMQLLTPTIRLQLHLQFRNLPKAQTRPHQMRQLDRATQQLIMLMRGKVAVGTAGGVLEDAVGHRK